MEGYNAGCWRYRRRADKFEEAGILLSFPEVEVSRVSLLSQKEEILQDM